MILPLLSLGQMPLNIVSNGGDINSPGRGAQYWNAIQWNNVSAPIINGSTTGYTGYVRLEWDDLESSKGVYNFIGPYPSLEFWIRHFIDRGQSFAFGGVMTVCDMCGMQSYDGGLSLYPLYLHQMMQAESVKDWKTSGGVWIPNWNSPAYLARFQALNDTIARFIQNGSYTPSTGPSAGKLVRYTDVLEWVDIRGYGNFGEWHNYPYWGETPSSAVPTNQSLKNIINVTINSFPNTSLIVIGNVFDGGGASNINPEVGYYVLNISNNYGKIGWRRDNIGGSGDDAYLANNPNTYNGTRLDTAITNRWKYAMITGEPLNGSGSCCPLYSDIRREIGLYHYAGFGNGNYGANTQAVFDTIRNAFALTGYRYQISGSIDSILYNSSPFTININWKNIGASPLYQKRWKVSYILINSDGVKVQSFVSKADLYLLMNRSYTETFTLAVTNLGTYKVNLIVEDSTGYFMPLPLNINSRNTDGSYTIATVQVKNMSALPLREDNHSRENNYRTEIKIYPNPVLDELNIELARNTSKPVLADIYDVTGRMIMRHTSYSDNFRINTSQLKNGIYIFKLYNKYNFIQRVEKLVKWK